MGRIEGLLTVLALAGMLAGPAFAHAHGSCEALRLKASGARCKGMVRCYVSAANSGEPVAACVDDEVVRLQSQFERAAFIDGESCPPFGEPEDVIAILDVFADDLAQTLVLAGDKCSRAKITGAAKQCVVQLRNCHATAHRKEIPVEQLCLDAAAEKTTRIFAKAENRFSCATIDDVDTAQARVVQVVDEVVAELTVAP